MNENKVRYLIVGGYAVGFYGYVRATADLDIWIKMDRKNATRIVAVLSEFGFDVPELTVELFEQENKIIRMGVPPVRIELQTTISGVEFDACYKRRRTEFWDDVEVNWISLSDLKRNKKAAGRQKDLNDLEHL